jgi:hypothetical protein
LPLAKTLNMFSNNEVNKYNYRATQTAKDILNAEIFELKTVLFYTNMYRFKEG